MKSIKLRTPDEVAKAREAGHLIAEVLAMLKPHVQPGVTTEALDDLCRDYIVNTLKCTPSNIGYHGYPKTACISPNHVVCHGIPSKDKKLKKGDIVNVDVTLTKDGWFGDSSRMFIVGEANVLARRLVHSPFGLSLRGIREGARRMPAVGAPVRRHLVRIYTIAAAIAGIAGALLAQTTQFVALDVLAFQRSAELLIMLVLGGAGVLYGAIIGAAVFMVAQDWLSGINPVYWQFWLGLLLVLIVLFARGGLLGALAAARARWGRNR